jgi:hypothetical protein
MFKRIADQQTFRLQTNLSQNEPISTKYFVTSDPFLISGYLCMSSLTANT